MKIISKYKDYYDYLAGIYGIDEYLVYDRTKCYIEPYIPSNYSKVNLHIGEWQIQGIWMDGKVLYGEEVIPYIKKNNHYFYSNEKDKYYVLNDSYNTRILKKPINLGDKSPTWEYECPILIKNGRGTFGLNPILKTYNVSKVFSAHEVWIILNEWLGKLKTKNEKPVPIGDDNLRLLAHGYDLKTSFRNVK